MNRKRLLLAIFLPVPVILGGFLTACTPAPVEPAPSSFEVTDQLGRVVAFEQIPQRIISIAPSNTEIVFALGLEDKLVAVTDYCDYPPEAKGKPSIGSYSTPNIEEIVAQYPDLVLATSIHEKKIIPQIEEQGLTVLALSPSNLSEVMAAITLIGQVTGQEAAAAGVVAGIEARVKAVTDKTDGLPAGQRPRVFYTVWHDPLLTSGAGTIQDELIQKAGGTNIAAELNDYADISLETVLDVNPEIMIAGVSHGSGQSLNFDFISTEPRLDGTAARQNDRIYAIDGNLTSRPGPRLVDGLEQFAEFLHPELFQGE
jgi:iron complex transport system substrate-binding protein